MPPLAGSYQKPVSKGAQEDVVQSCHPPGAQNRAEKGGQWIWERGGNEEQKIINTSGKQEAHWPCHDADFAMTWVTYGLNMTAFNPGTLAMAILLLVGSRGGMI